MMLTSTLPFMEGALLEGANLQEMFESNPKNFWKFHKKYSEMPIHSDFRDLFTQMVCSAPRNRISIADIKKSKWFNGPTCSSKELKEAMAMFQFNKIIDQWEWF